MVYPSQYDPEYAERLLTHMEQGLSFESFGALAGVSKQTLYNWLDVHEDFAEAKQQGEMKSLLFWEQLGRAGAAGKMSGFNATSWIFNMKNRFRKYGWADKPIEEEKPTHGQVHIYLPHNGRDPLPTNL